MNTLTDRHLIRPETLLEFGHGWEAPTPQEVVAVFNRCDLTRAQIAEMLGLGERAIFKWTKGDSRIPYAAWRLLCLKVGLLDVEKI